MSVRLPSPHNHDAEHSKIDSGTSPSRIIGGVVSTEYRLVELEALLVLPWKFKYVLTPAVSASFGGQDRELPWPPERQSRSVHNGRTIVRCGAEEPVRFFPPGGGGFPRRISLKIASSTQATIGPDSSPETPYSSRMRSHACADRRQRTTAAMRRWSRLLRSGRIAATTRAICSEFSLVSGEKRRGSALNSASARAAM